MYQTAEDLEIGNSSTKFLADFKQGGSLLRNIKSGQNGNKTQNIPNNIKDNTYLKENANRKPNLKLGSSRKRTNEPTPSTSSSSNEAKILKKPKFALLPVISNTNRTPKQIKPNKTNYEPKSNKTNNQQDQKSQSKKDIGKIQNLVIITGTIDFALKISKTFKDIAALYEVFGKIIRICDGKHSCEKIIFLRSSKGPVLHGIFYEIDAKMLEISAGNIVCCIGKSIGFNKMQIFKIKVIPSFPTEGALARFQNICNFTLNKLKSVDS